MTTQAPRNPPFRAEHIGSLLRPDFLLEARKPTETGGTVDYKDLKPVEDKAINEIVEKQLQWGYHAVSDGEYRRQMFWGTFFSSLDGMKEIFHPTIDIFREYVPDIAGFLETGQKPANSVICVGKVKHTGNSTYIDQFNYLKGLLPQDQHKNIKISMVAPNWYHLRYKEGKAFPKDVYKTDEEYFDDVAKAYSTELKILYDAGCRNIQVDDPNLAYFCSEKMIAGWKEDPTNSRSSEELFDSYIKFYNDCFKRPDDMHLGIHLCRGNFIGSRHFSEGGYDRISTKLFQNLNASTYYLEYDTPRAGGFEPLKSLPKNKNVILGIVTSKFAEMEDKEEMKKRVYQAADIIAEGNGETREQALKRIGVSPQCGFASHAVGNAIDHKGMENKLKFVREIANEVWNGEP